MDQVYVTGGMDEERVSLSSIEKYSPSSDTWSVVSFLPEPRANHVAVGIGSAMYVLGGRAGFDHTAQLTANVIKFDSSQGIWSEVAPMPNALHSFAACALGSDIYVFGGSTHDNTLGNQRSVFKYDTETDNWSH
jgi:N-acetylneuraminic acid mutarotase